jgi:hypothetical protein
MSLLNKILPPPLTNPFFSSPGQALDAVIRPVQQQLGIPGSYQFIEQGIGKLLRGKTPMERAKVGQPMILNNQLGYKAADGTWQPRGDMESENIPQYLPGSAQADKSGYVWDKSPAADRAYEAEKSRVAQLTAQDPELQRYEKARKDAKTQEEMNAARDIGMQIWQQKYGGTPMGQPGGAVGMDNPLMLKTFGYQSGSAPDQQMGAYTQGPTPNIPQIDQMLNPAGPSYLGGEGAPLMNFGDENLTPEMIEAYQKQLLGQAAARK